MNSEGKIICPRFCGEKEKIAYLSGALSTFEEEPNLYEKMMKELITD
jgi:hypothetical protein